MALAEYRHTDTRRHQRESQSVLSLTIDGLEFKTLNWSLGGCLIEGYGGEFSAGSLINLTSIRRGDKVVPVDVRARVIRALPGDKHLVIGFLDVDVRAFHFLRECMES
jgi:hypothetical protein